MSSRSTPEPVATQTLRHGCSLMNKSHHGRPLPPRTSDAIPCYRSSDANQLSQAPVRLPPADSGGRPKGRSGPGLTRSGTLERRKSQLLRAVHKTTIISEILDNRTKELVSVRSQAQRSSHIVADTTTHASLPDMSQPSICANHHKLTVIQLRGACCYICCCQASGKPVGLRLRCT